MNPILSLRIAADHQRDLRAGFDTHPAPSGRVTATRSPRRWRLVARTAH